MVINGHRNANRNGRLAALLSCSLVPWVAIAGAPSIAHFPAPAAAQRQAAVASAAPRWSLGQVDALIAEIETADDAGLDPSDYCLAALKGERLHTTDFLRSGGSRQLDTLADVAALALARDYANGKRQGSDQFEWPEARGAAGARLAPTLHIAVAKGRLREWLRGLRAAASTSNKA